MPQKEIANQKTQAYFKKTKKVDSQVENGLKGQVRKVIEKFQNDSSYNESKENLNTSLQKKKKRKFLQENKKARKKNQLVRFINRLLDISITVKTLHNYV